LGLVPVPVPETTKYLKNKSSEFGSLTHVIRLRGAIDTILQFDCFRQIYSSILTAALVLYMGAGAEPRKNDDDGRLQPNRKVLLQNINKITERCYAMQSLGEGKYVLRGYASSLELFPGVFYGSLMISQKQLDYGSEDYYKDNPARKSFMDLFTKFVRTLLFIEESDLIRESPSHRMIAKDLKELTSCIRTVSETH
jgi:hypothetical protein